jgi:chitin disaccharide deacetylase
MGTQHVRLENSRLRIELRRPISGQQNDAKRQYLNALRGLQPGAHELIVHLGYDDRELHAIMVDHPDFGSAWRQRDYEIVTSEEFRHALSENHITLISWRELGKARQQR